MSDERLIFQVFCYGPFWKFWRWRALAVKCQLRFLVDDGPPVFLVPRNFPLWIHEIPLACALGMLMVGCAPPETTKPADPFDESLKHLSSSIELLNKWTDLNGKTEALALDCANVDHETWVQRHCSERKSELVKEGDALKAERP